MTVINLSYGSMKKQKDNQRETLTVELAMWTLFCGVIYVLFKGVSW
jgi:hypothetical protein